MTIHADYESFLFQNLGLGDLYEATKNNEFNNKRYIKSIIRMLYIYICIYTTKQTGATIISLKLKKYF